MENVLGISGPQNLQHSSSYTIPALLTAGYLEVKVKQTKLR